MRGFLAFALCASVSQPAVSAGQPVWVVDDARSSVFFQYSEDGRSVDGAFERYSARIEFDPTMLTQTTATLAVDTASIDLDDALREGVLLTPPWFDADAFPRAVFELTSLSFVAEDRYRAEGFLTIKSVRMPVNFDLVLTLDQGNARVRGTLEIDRNDYRLRDALLESVISVSETVSIGFDLVARSSN